jgi:hypothetical protein
LPRSITCPGGSDGDARLGAPIAFRVDACPLVEGCGEVVAPAEPVGGVFGQRLEEHLIELCQIRAVIAQPRQGSVEMLADDGHRVGMLIRRSTSET